MTLTILSSLSEWTVVVGSFDMAAETPDTGKSKMLEFRTPAAAESL